MAGFNSVTGDESVVYCDNMSFDGTQRGGKLAVNGQLFIGSGSAPHVRKGVIKSNGGTVTVTYDAPDINLEAAGGSVTLTGDTGTPIAGSSLTVFTNAATQNSGATVKFNNGAGVSTLNVTDSDSNTMIGRLNGNSTYSGSGNTGVGDRGLLNLSSGSFNCAFGSQALEANNTGTGNVAVGWATLNLNTSGSFQVAVGMEALSNNTGNANIALGYQAMFTAGSTTNSVCIGYQTGHALSGGTGNVAIGTLAMNSLTVGGGNTVLGNQAGQAYNGAESNNILIGNGVTGTNGESNVTRIGTGQTGCVISGISGVTVTGSAVLCATDGTLGTIASSERYKENIRPIEDSILSLTPVKFNYTEEEPKRDHYGFIAEDVHAKFPDLCLYDDDGRPESVKYHEMYALLLNEIKVLHQRIDSLRSA